LYLKFKVSRPEDCCRHQTGDNILYFLAAYGEEERVENVKRGEMKIVKGKERARKGKRKV